MPKASVNGIMVHYQQLGRGQDLVMIHGLFANLAFWYLSVLPELIRDFRVTVYDLRGHGYSDMPPSGYTPSGLAFDLNALLDHLGVERTHLVGHSFGGAVCLRYAVLQPDRVRSLTLADARVPGLQPAFPPLSAKRWRIRNARLRRVGIEVPEDLPRVAYSYFEELARLQRRKKRAKADPGAEALLGGWNGNSRVSRRWIQLIRATTAPVDLCDVSGLTADCLGRVNQPSLAVYGQYSDCLLTLRGLEQHLPDCTTVIVPGVGHFHPVLKPHTFVRALKQFIANVRT